jgi:hypothetical protein
MKLIMTKKEIIYTSIIIVLVMLIIPFLILNSQKYSAADIDADNFRDGIVGKWYDGNNESIDEANLANSISDNFSLYQAYEFVTSDNYNDSGLEIRNKATERGHDVVIFSKHTDLRYEMLFDKRNIIFSLGIMYGRSEENKYETKKIVDKLILKSGFTLKKSKLIDGYDIIIKELPDKFIIVTLYGKYEEPPFCLLFRSYSKKKYFKF